MPHPVKVPVSEAEVATLIERGKPALFTIPASHLILDLSEEDDRETAKYLLKLRRI